MVWVGVLFVFKVETANGVLLSLVGSEICIRDKWSLKGCE